MSDIFGLGNINQSLVQEFDISSGGVGPSLTSGQWYTWKKPSCNFVYMFLMGAGGGGGNGFTRAAAAAGGGGGGGGGASITKLIFSAFMLPDTLAVWVPGGGTATATGGTALVANRPTASLANGVFAAASGGGGGSSGTGAAVGVGGGGGAVFGSTSFGQLGLSQSLAGTTGGNGGAIAGGAGVAVTAWGTMPCSAGSGGGGTTSADFAGGAISFTSGIILGSTSATLPGGAAGSNPGNIGHTFPTGFFSPSAELPLLSCGGSGGGGGLGGRGSGGGGGGAGTTGGTGGTGGTGYVVIACW